VKKEIALLSPKNGAQRNSGVVLYEHIGGANNIIE